MAFVTFIVPSIGRASLELALESLQRQTDPDWSAVVVCDDWERTYEGPTPEDHRILWTGGEKYGSAGDARNVGLEWCFRSSTLPHWIGFLDDDDRLAPTYVEHLREHVEDYPWAELVIFRMKHPQLGVLPPPNGELRQGTVGISFALRLDVASERRFVRENVPELYHEDWMMIQELTLRGHRGFISPHIDYFVREAHE